MRFLFLNQYAPPDPSPTARLLGELADFLRGHGHEVEIISQGQGYQGRPIGGRGRLRRELKGLAAIFRAGWKSTRHKPDLILALSSPPGLPVVAALLAWLRRVRLAHWAMDVYPELALALGEIGSGAAFRIVRAAMTWAYRRTALVVVLDEDMAAHLQSIYQVKSQVLAPWPAMSFERQAAAETDGQSDDRNIGGPWVWLYSGNLGRAHEWETLLDAQCLLEARGLPVHLVFQGDGASRAAAIDRAKQLSLQRCDWKGYVAEEGVVGSLMAARLLVVTQRPETRGLLWPSKLAALEKLPRPILYVGPAEGAIANQLHSRGNAGVFAPGQAEAVAHWIEEQFHLQSTPSECHQFQPTGINSCDALECWLVDCIQNGL